MASGPLPTPPSIHADAKAFGQDDGLSIFASVRTRLFGIAYRMLGSVAEAEDVVQDIWMRWQSMNRSTVENPPAYLATATTRQCINILQSARTRRETYIGTWLPEPVDTSSDPRIGAEKNEALKFAVLLLLEKLSPTERAAYILREAFDYEYSEIAEILHLQETNIRQLVSRARKHIANGRRTSVAPSEQRRLMEAFVAAAQNADMAALEALLAEDVVSYADGGGIVHAAAAPVSGRKHVATFISALSKWCWKGVTLDWVETNGQTTVLVLRDGVPFGLTIDASAQGIAEIMWFLRPSKLSAVKGSPRARVSATSQDPKMAECPQARPTHRAVFSDQKSLLEMMLPTVKVGQRFKFTVLTDDALIERLGVVIRVFSNREEGLGLDVDQYMSYWVEAHELPETEFSTTLVFVRSADGKIYLDGKAAEVTLLP